MSKQYVPTQYKQVLFAIQLMHSSTLEQTTQSNVQVKVKERFVFVVQLHDGRFVIGAATNPCRRITAINSGMNKAVPKTLQVNRIIGIKEHEC